MARIFREKSSDGAGAPANLTAPADLLPSPFGDLGVQLSEAELRETAYEIFAGACRSVGGRPLTYTSSSDRSAPPPPQAASAASGERSPSPSPSSSDASSLQRSLTSTAASKMKRALGIKSSSSVKKGGSGTPGKESSGRSSKRPATVGELVRVQMWVSEQADARIRRGLLRAAAGQLGRRVESMVLPLELLQQFNASDFRDQQEYGAWKIRILKVLEAGLLLHPHQPLEKSDIASQRLRQIIRGLSERQVETSKNSESMQALRTAVVSLASRSFDGSVDTCHWADGFPLNLHLYQRLLEACFDSSEEGSLIEEIDEVMELIKKTWAILGINQLIHNLCFLWALFKHFVSSSQVDSDLLLAADNQLTEVAKDAKTTKDPLYSKILNLTLSSILGWSEKRLLAYHDTFNPNNVGFMQTIVSLGVSSAKMLVEDIFLEYRRKRREEVDVARSRIDTYIRSSLRTAFAQRMEEADSSRRLTGTHVLLILANNIGDLAITEKDTFSPIMKRWHPIPAGVAAATLHTCYGNELKQFLAGFTELSPDYIEVLKAADKLEKTLVEIAVHESVDSDDGGKSIVREMPPYEVDRSIGDLTKLWIKTRVDKLKEWIDRNLQQEVWSPDANKESFASSAVEVLRIVDETLDAYFGLPIPKHYELLSELISGLDRSIQHYISTAKSGCGTKNTYIPALPALTRCEIRSKLWSKKEKTQNTQKRNTQVVAVNGNSSFGLPQLCVRLNTIYHIRSELENVEKKIITCLRNSESAEIGISNELDKKFELSQVACQEGIQRICEATAYKVIFQDLSRVLWNALYTGEPSASRIEPLLKELDPILEMISNTVHSRVRNRIITALMKASFDGFLLVLLAGGPSRAFVRQDSQIIEEDFRSLKDLYFADGDGLPEELIEKAAVQASNIIPLFQLDTQSLIDRYKRVVTEGFGASAKSKYQLPPTSGHWSPTDGNTILRVLCHRYDADASKYLKKAYNLPKK